MSMAATISLYFPFDTQNLHHPCRLLPTSVSKPLQACFFTHLLPFYKYLLSTFHRDGSCSFKFSSSSSSSSSSSHSSATATTLTSSYHEDPFSTGRCLSNKELEKLKFLTDFVYFKELKYGSLWVRVMGAEEMEMTIGLLAESFAESMVLPAGYVSVLKFLVKQYLMERKVQMPHMMLMGFYIEIGEGGEEQELQLAGTVEVCFNKRGANVSLYMSRFLMLGLVELQWLVWLVVYVGVLGSSQSKNALFSHLWLLIITLFIIDFTLNLWLEAAKFW